MTKVVFKVDFAGPHVSIQDAGRAGHMRFGVPASGPMDRLSMAAVNLALGHSAQRACIEISLGGLSLTCLSGELTIAVAGGGFIVELSGQRRGSWGTMQIRTGDRLVIRPGPWGCWTYLAFSADILAQSWLRSLSTHTTSGMGGGKLQTGQILELSNAQSLPKSERKIPCPVIARPRHQLRCVLGPQDRFFDPETLSDLTQSVFSVSTSYDRMGVRLTGPKVMSRNALGIPSEPILRGSVQVSGDGVPTVLMADHQTTGGYPKIATVLDCDLDAFAQCRPGDRIGFRAVSAETAINVARFSRRQVDGYLASVSPQ